MRNELLRVWPSGISTLADLGCRDCWHTANLPGVTRHIGVDIWPEALERGKRKAAAGHITGFVPVLQEAIDWLMDQPDKSIDAVVAIDLIEHLAPVRAEELVENMMDVARKFVCVWTTLGFIETGPFDIDGNPNPHEVHVWGPTAEFFEDYGWNTTEYPEWHESRGGGLLAWLCID